MSTSPINPMPHQDPDPDVVTPPDPDRPLTDPATDPEPGEGSPDEEEPDQQLPRH